MKLPSFLNYLVYNQNKSCDLWVYLNRPRQLHQYKYTELFSLYIATLKLPQRYFNNNLLLDVEFFIIDNPSLPFPVYLCKRQRVDKAIVRMEMLYVMSGEIWYFRQILLKRAIISINDAKTGPDGTIYTSFQEAALSHGYVKDGEEGLQCFRQVK